MYVWFQSAPQIVVNDSVTVCLPFTQVAGSLPAQQQVHSLTSIVKHTAAEHVPLAAVMQPQRLTLLTQLLQAEPAVAVLAAEVLCRVCSLELQPWGSQLARIVPDLMAVVEQCSSSSSRSSSAGGSSSADEAQSISSTAAGGTASASSSSSSTASGTADASQNEEELMDVDAQKQRLPLLFFAVSALVRMSSDKEVAQAVVACGGVPVLVHALRVSPPAVCQVSRVAYESKDDKTGTESTSHC
jgi:hypothetical protein